VEGYRALILDAVFPRRCVTCGAYGNWCCDPCLSKIELVRRDPCARCFSLKVEHECETDAEAFDGMVVGGFYHDPTLRALIHGLKYHSAHELMEEIARFLRRMRSERNAPWPWAGEKEIAVQPLIGSERRIRERGFDQAVAIGDAVIQEIIPWATSISALERAPSLAAQVEIEPGPLRSANVAGTFRFLSNAPIPSTVLLVDDVCTTGSTMRDAARAFRAAGVKRVYGFAVAAGK
jgi:predicted amidophosphoribosyltransferase